MKNRLLFLSLVFAVQGFAQQLLFVNEYQSSNTRTISDDDGDFEDWVELYSTAPIPVSLAGYYLSDDDSRPLKWQFPAITIHPGEYLIIWASGKDRVQNGIAHTNFRLSSAGEPVILSAPNGMLLDRLPAKGLLGDQSFGRLPDGGDSLVTFGSGTPGSLNLLAPVINLTDTILFSMPQGFYSKPIFLEMQATDTTGGVEIRYSFEGKYPDKIYQNPIFLDFNPRKMEGYMTIPSAVPSHMLMPVAPVPTAYAIRAQCFRNGLPSSPEVFATYFVHSQVADSLNMPHISLISHPGNLFDADTGIYVPGNDLDNMNFNMTGRFWERIAHVTYFEKNQTPVVHQTASMRVHGGGTRQSPQKTLRLYARGEYGKSSFDHKFFKQKEIESFKRLIIGTTRGDWSHTLFKDELTSLFVEGMAVDYQAFEPVVLYINGEYWGIHFLRERIDKYFLEDNRGVDPENLDLISFRQTADEGDLFALNHFLDRLEQGDPIDPDYWDMVQNEVDIPRFIDYYAANIFLSNMDWIHNYRRWRERADSAKWNFIFFDCDACMMRHERDFIGPLISGDIEELPNYDHAYVEIARHLFQIPEVKELFYNRMISLLETNFEQKRMLRQLDSLVAHIEPEIHEHMARWGRPRSITEWQQNISEIETFIYRRHGIVMRQLDQIKASPFSISPVPFSHTISIRDDLNTRYHPEISISDAMGRIIEIRGREISAYPQLDLDLSDLSPGFYIVQIQLRNLIFRHKIIKY
jgi:hypothetical protein